VLGSGAALDQLLLVALASVVRVALDAIDAHNREHDRLVSGAIQRGDQGRPTSPVPPATAIFIDGGSSHLGSLGRVGEGEIGARAVCADQ
jgi:hypothetical protein